MTGLGCDFLTEPCNDRSTFPYLCDTSPAQLVCAYDHLTKVCIRSYCNVIVYTYVVIIYVSSIIVTYARATAITFGLALMVALLYFLLIVRITVELKQ